MPILKDKGPVKPPKPVVEGNCYSCRRMSTDCPVKQQVAQEIIRDSAAFRVIALADTPCGGDEYRDTPVSASMAKAVALGRVKMVGSVEKVREYRAVEAAKEISVDGTVERINGIPVKE